MEGELEASRLTPDPAVLFDRVKRPGALPPGKALLVVAHPGHELRVHHWCELVRPDVAVLTDGSGQRGASRIDRTTKLLSRVGARPAQGFYAPVTDRRLYNAVLNGEARVVTDLADRLTALLVDGRYDYVLGDAAEGTILGHDILRGILDASLATARRLTGRRIASFDFPLTANPGSINPRLISGAYRLQLDAEALDRKLAAGRAYTELVHEVEEALQAFGREAFATEFLRPSLTEAGIAPFEGKPGYERHGEARVAQGDYAAVVRHDEHVAPLLCAVQQHLAANQPQGSVTAERC